MNFINALNYNPKLFDFIYRCKYTRRFRRDFVFKSIRLSGRSFLFYAR